MNKSRLLVTTIFIYFLSCTAQAAPITYVFTGTGSGHLDSTSFLDADFVVHINANTDDIETYWDNEFVGYTTPWDRVTNDGTLEGVITIEGIGELNFTDLIWVYNYVIGQDQGPGFGNGSKGDLISLNVLGVGLDTYDLKSSFGPITDPTPFFRQFVNVQMDKGLLTYTSMSNATFTAILNPVPIPASFCLFGSGLLGLVGIASNRAAV